MYGPLVSSGNSPCAEKVSRLFTGLAILLENKYLNCLNINYFFLSKTVKKKMFL